MSSSPHSSSDSTMYYSAYCGPVFDKNGNFIHFALKCDAVHLKSGYWKFSTYYDDRQAYLRGFNKPEEVLKAQDAGDGDLEDILLCWVPGEQGTMDPPLAGTAAAHLQTICDKRKLLGLTLAFRGAVPMYPLSIGTGHSQSQVPRQELFKEVVPNDLLSPSRPPKSSFPVKSPSSPPTLLMTLSQSTSRYPKSVSKPLSTSLSPQRRCKPVESPRLDPTPAASPPNGAPVQANPVIETDETADLNETLHYMQHGEPEESIQHNHSGASPLGLPASNVEDVKSDPSGDPPASTAHQRLFDGNFDPYCMHGSDKPDDDSTGEPTILSFTSVTPADLFHVQAASLPCMDCNSLGNHTYDCWINKAALSLTCTEDLTESELRRLVGVVDRIDLWSWPTHFGPQQEADGNDQTQLQGIAEVIRNLDETANDLELQGLDDQCTILLWAFKSIGDVQNLNYQSEQNQIEPSSMWPTDDETGAWEVLGVTVIAQS